MAAIATVTLTDVTPVTPVAHAFTPTRVGQVGRNTEALWEDREANTGIAVGFFRLHVTYSPPSADRKSYRLGMKVTTPVLEVTSNSTVSGIEPAPTISHVPLFQGEFVFPERASLQNRKDLRAMVLDLLGEAMITNLVESLEPPY